MGPWTARPSTKPPTGPTIFSRGYARALVYVMAHESFEIRRWHRFSTNIHPIKVDREERPDVDASICATQLVSGTGGWPMSVFWRRRATLHGRHLLSRSSDRQVSSPRC